LSRDKSLIYRETTLFSGFASRQWFKNVLDVEVGEIMSVSLAGVGLLFQPNENKPWSNACVRTVTQFFLVARLIKDKAHASSTVNQSVI